MSEKEISDMFFDHFSQDKTTKIGMWLTRTSHLRIFKCTQLTCGCSVLEIGPGRGVFADICLKQGVEYFAIEPNQQMADCLEQRGANVVRAMVPPLPPLDNKFDVAVMISVMEHMNGMGDALEITRQIRRLLKPKGKFVIYSPDYLNWRLNFFNCDFSHNYVTTLRRLRQLLHSAGFKNIKACYVSGPLTGAACFFVTALVSRLPFRLLNALFPNSMVFHKLYKLQLTFLKNVLIFGEKPED